MRGGGFALMQGSLCKQRLSAALGELLQQSRRSKSKTASSSNM
jgi:hypothetical protein